MLTYMEHYPHYMGTMNTSAKIEDMDLMLIAELYQRGDQEDQDMIYDMEENGFEEILTNVKSNGSGPYAIESFMTGDFCNDARAQKKYWKATFKDLETKGFSADLWEEGSYGICVEGKEKELEAAIAKLEARISEDTFCW